MTGNKRKWIWFAVITVVIAVLLSPFASSHPDGLERVAEDHGFIEQAEGGFALSPFADYVVNVPLGETWQVALAGLIGILVMAAVLWGIGKLFTVRSKRRV